MDPAKLWKYHLTKESRKAFQILCYVLNVAAYGDDVIAPHFVMYDILEDIPEYLRTERWSFKWAREYVEKGVTPNPEKYNEHVFYRLPHVPFDISYVTDVSIPCMNVNDDFCIVCVRLHNLSQEYGHDLGLCTRWEKNEDSLFMSSTPKFNRINKNTFNFVCMCRKHNKVILINENGIDTQPLPDLENGEPGPVHVVASLYCLDPEAMWEFVHVEGQTEITAFHDESECFANKMASSYVEEITKEYKQQLPPPNRFDGCAVSRGARISFFGGLGGSRMKRDFLGFRDESPTRLKRRGKSGGGKCFNCGLPGHVKRDCPGFHDEHPTRVKQSNGGKCFSCGLPGHRARDCPYY